MIKLSWFEIGNPQFQEAVRTIWDCPMLDAKTSYTAHRIRQGIESANRQIIEVRKSLIAKWAKKDEKGEAISDARGFVQFNEGDGEKFEADFQKEFEGRGIELKVSKINFECLTQVRGISPRQWEFLEPIIENLPKEEEPAPQEEPAP